MNKVFVIRRQFFIAVLPAALLAMAFAPSANAYTPESPEVKKMVTAGVKYLEAHGIRHDRLGASALLGLVKFKQTHKVDDPLVLDCVKHIRQFLGNLDSNQLGKDSVYDIGLTLVFLTELDLARKRDAKPKEYAPEVKYLLENLALRQKSCGAWGYDNRVTGDTSMTQYGVLGYWTALRNGYDIPVERIDAVADWLLKTQDPSGAFGYQGVVSSSYTPVRQSGVRHSMAAAGLGSVYICANMLGIKSKVESPKKPDILPVLQRVAEKEVAKKTDGNKKKLKSRLSPKLFRTAGQRGDGWFKANRKIDPPEWTYYYLYALERYETFREIAEGKQILEPKWYNDGIVFLQKTQNDDGSWDGQGEEIHTTCFALLFMLRASGTTVRPVVFGEGVLGGGRDIPADTDDLVVRDEGVRKQSSNPGEEMGEILRSGNWNNINDFRRRMLELPPTEVQAIVVEHKALLYQLAGHQLGEARLAALEMMEKTRDLDYVPILIYVLMTDGLKDKDARVACKARDVLRRFARKPKGFGMPDQPNKADRMAAAAAWKQWYLAVRPDGKFNN